MSTDKDTKENNYVSKNYDHTYGIEINKNTSKYERHQGKKECMKRLERLHNSK